MDTVKCDGKSCLRLGAYIKRVIVAHWFPGSGEVDQNHPMTTHHRGAEEARRAHNPKDGGPKPPDDIEEDGHSEVCDGYVRWKKLLALGGTYQTSHCSVMGAY